jgi:hypothetical protein
MDAMNASKFKNILREIRNDMEHSEAVLLDKWEEGIKY